MSQIKSTPQHIAIIMDGNRRWAKQRGLFFGEGHSKVANEVIENLALHCIKRGVPYLTMWAFSTENWQREQEEVGFLMDLFRQMLRDNIDRLHQHGIRIRMIGNLKSFPDDIQQEILTGLKETEQNKNLDLTFALSYGGRDEIKRATQKIARQIRQGKIEPENIDEELISANLDTAELPDVDLIIRAGGEQRLSGFLPWQGVYSELYLTEVLMPDFDEAELDEALAEFQRRQRRFGK